MKTRSKALAAVCQIDVLAAGMVFLMVFLALWLDSWGVKSQVLACFVLP